MDQDRTELRANLPRHAHHKTLAAQRAQPGLLDPREVTDKQVLQGQMGSQEPQDKAAVRVHQALREKQAKVGQMVNQVLPANPALQAKMELARRHHLVQRGQQAAPAQVDHRAQMEAPVSQAELGNPDQRVNPETQDLPDRMGNRGRREATGYQAAMRLTARAHRARASLFTDNRLPYLVFILVCFVETKRKTKTDFLTDGS